MGQTSWARDITTRRAGAPADMHTAARRDSITKRNADAGAIFPGRFVVSDVATAGYVKIQDSGAVLAGTERYYLAIENTNRERVQGSTATEGYVQNALTPVALDGRWYVETEEAVAENEQVYIRFVAGAGGTVIGKARNDADTASCEAINARFVETTTAAGLAQVELNLHQV